MTRLTQKKKGITINLKENSEKQKIIAAIKSTGNVEVYDSEGELILYFKSNIINEDKSDITHNNLKRKIYHKPRKNSKKTGILEQVVKSQNITLAKHTSTGVVYSGIIVK